MVELVEWYGCWITVLKEYSEHTSPWQWITTSIKYFEILRTRYDYWESGQSSSSGLFCVIVFIEAAVS